TDTPQLPNAEPMPFNPVRTYLGTRNTVRLLRRYAKPTHRLAFGLALARLLPLETMAAIVGAESWYPLGPGGWRRVAGPGSAGGRGATWPTRTCAILGAKTSAGCAAWPRFRWRWRGGFHAISSAPRAVAGSPRSPRRCAGCATASSTARFPSSGWGCGEPP